MAFLNNMASALAALRSNVSVLPAVGGAVEYLQRPDADEVDDSFVNQDLSVIDEFAETNPPANATGHRRQ